MQVEFERVLPNGKILFICAEALMARNEHNEPLVDDLILGVMLYESKWDVSGRPITKFELRGLWDDLEAEAISKLYDAYEGEIYESKYG